MLWTLAIVLNLAPLFADPAVAEPETVVVLPASARAALAKPPLKDAADLELYVDVAAARVRIGDVVWMALIVDGQVQRLAPLPRVRECLPVELPVEGYWIAAGSEPTLMALGNDAWVAVWSDKERCWLGERLFAPPELERGALSARGPTTEKSIVKIVGVGALSASTRHIELGSARVELIETSDVAAPGERELMVWRSGGNVLVSSSERSAGDAQPQIERRVSVLLDPHQVEPLRYDEVLSEVHPAVGVIYQAAASVRLPVPSGTLVGERALMKKSGRVDGPSSMRVSRWKWSLQRQGATRLLTPDTSGTVELAELTVNGRGTTRQRFTLGNGKRLDVTLTARSLKLVVQGGGRLELKAEGPRLRDQNASVSLSQNSSCERAQCWLSVSWSAQGETLGDASLETSSESRSLLWPVMGGAAIENMRQRSR